MKDAQPGIIIRRIHRAFDEQVATDNDIDDAAGRRGTGQLAVRPRARDVGGEGDEAVVGGREKVGETYGRAGGER